MAFQGSLLLGLFLLLTNVLVLIEVSLAANVPSHEITLPFNRTIFPSEFIFGASSSTYQYEGAWNEDGKGPSICDTFTHTHPEKILDHSNGDVALDFYHRYKDDLKLAKFEGLDAFRFSISWTRILPHGKLSKGINQAGIDHYNSLINEIVALGIKPLATLFHWDVPQALEDDYLGFLSPKIVEDFLDFVEICFKFFGDRVKLWSTMNEPWIFSVTGYDSGTLAPGRCSVWRNNNCSAGNSATEPYTVSHNILLAHAAAAKLYRQKYKPTQKGEIGIILVSHWFEPFSNKPEDIRASRRALDFMLGWLLHPLTYGDYPIIMKGLVGKRLPKFTPKESELVKGSFDFLGMNYYTSNFAAHLSSPLNTANVSFTTDNQVNQTTSRNGQLVGDPTGVSIFFVAPRGLYKLLLYIKKHYKNPKIYITECGMGESNITKVEEGVNDIQRVDFYKRHIKALYEAFKEGVNVHGFFAWSFFDNFEWGSGYTQKFGINFIDYKNNLKRYPKKSALWMKRFLLK
ncbi:beta-glucosidase 12-like isoform X1 [Nicotiana sylvestris]|uniref:Beta-glucosidase 12-like isoform X1 n=1 Tax=Nicotiana sylvestris TaxID=4096 RepID=A0A1U7V8T6_NICSY|nr:PREDICTED: beta-glucosidase 12-like isoform X1 [Nicotiana sylvestris]